MEKPINFDFYIVHTLRVTWGLADPRWVFILLTRAGSRTCFLYITQVPTGCMPKGALRNRVARSVVTSENNEFVWRLG